MAAHSAADGPEPAPTRSLRHRTFRKRTYRLGTLTADALQLVPHLGDLAAIYARKRMNPRVREAIMVAVAQANACRYCSFVHGAWAAWLGLRDVELAQLRGHDVDVLERRVRLAAEHAVRLVSPDSADTTGHDATQAFTLDELSDIETVARAMSLANRVGNTFDALLARLEGAADPDGRVVDELVVSSLFLLAAPPVVAGLAVLRRQAPWTILGEFKTFSAAFEAGAV